MIKRMYQLLKQNVIENDYNSFVKNIDELTSTQYIIPGKQTTMLEADDDWINRVLKVFMVITFIIYLLLTHSQKCFVFVLYKYVYIHV